MLTEIKAYGINGSAWSILQKWYHGYQAKITLGGSKTEPFHISVGTRQGSVLSPVFFAVAMNGLIRKLKNEGRSQGGAGLGIRVGDYNLPILMQADDIVLLAHSTQELQTLLDLTAAYIDSWKMDFSISKCRVMALRQTNPSPPPPLSLKVPTTNAIVPGNRTGVPIDWCDHYKYLGTVLSHGEEMFEEGITQRCATAMGEAKELASGSRSRTCTPFVDRADIYLSTIAARRDYALHAIRLSTTQLDKIERNEQAIIKLLGIDKWIPLHRRVAPKLRHASQDLLDKLNRAPEGSWRRYLVTNLTV
jgi:hypothetical protein